MNIKKEIGKRIAEARREKGLTVKALGQLAGGLKQTRLTNWEQGNRAPGPEEIKQLAEALEVSPAFLMCLSDEKQYKTAKKLSRLVPLLNHRQASDPEQYIADIRQGDALEDFELIAVSPVLLPGLSPKAFALKMADESMLPEIRAADILIIDPAASPSPGDFVVVSLPEKSDVIVCQYKKLSYTSSEFELLTLNETWPDIKVGDGVEVSVVGKVLQRVCSYTK